MPSPRRLVSGSWRRRGLVMLYERRPKFPRLWNSHRESWPMVRGPRLSHFFLYVFNINFTFHNLSKHTNNDVEIQNFNFDINSNKHRNIRHIFNTSITIPLMLMTTWSSCDAGELKYIVVVCASVFIMFLVSIIFVCRKLWRDMLCKKLKCV